MSRDQDIPIYSLSCGLSSIYDALSSNPGDIMWLRLTFPLNMQNQCCYCTDPHGHADGAVHVAFVQPAVFRHSSLLRTEGGRVLQNKHTLLFTLTFLRRMLLITTNIYINTLTVCQLCSSHEQRKSCGLVGLPRLFPHLHPPQIGEQPASQVSTPY